MAKIDIEGLLGQIAKEGAQENAHSAIDSAIEENELSSSLAPLLKSIDKTASNTEKGLEPILDYLMPVSQEESKYSDMATLIQLLPLLGAVPDRTITDASEAIEGRVSKGLHGLEHGVKGAFDMAKDTVKRTPSILKSWRGKGKRYLEKEYPGIYKDFYIDSPLASDFARGTTRGSLRRYLKKEYPGIYGNIYGDDMKNRRVKRQEKRGSKLNPESIVKRWNKP